MKTTQSYVNLKFSETKNIKIYQWIIDLDSILQMKLNTYNNNKHNFEMKR